MSRRLCPHRQEPRNPQAAQTHIALPMAAGLPRPEGRESRGPLRSLSRFPLVPQQSSSGWATQPPLPPVQLLEEPHSSGVRMMAIGGKSNNQSQTARGYTTTHTAPPGPSKLLRLERRSLPPRLFSIPLTAVIMIETMRRRGGAENEVMYVKHLAQGLVGNEQTPAPLPSPSNKMACG